MPKLSSSLCAALCGQILREFAASQTYLAMYLYFERKEFEGFASCFLRESDAEREHAKSMLAYLTLRGGTMCLPQIPAPDCDWGSPLEVLEGALTMEEANTVAINGLIESARQEKDNAMVAFLLRFMEEQV
jgi:ferritin